MAHKPKVQSVSYLVEHLESALPAYLREYDRLSLRQRIRRLIPIQNSLSDLGVSVAYESDIRAKSGLARILQYLQMHSGEIIDGEELALVSGINDYPRRVRELRVEYGYQIATGATPDPDSGIDLKTDQYILVSGEPDADSAQRWRIANEIRRSEQNTQKRLLKFLEANVGKVVTTEDLAYVAGGAREFARRIRELRTEQGYMIATKFTGRPDLKPGQYILESLERRAEPHDRRIDADTQKTIYKRDNSTCVCCGWNRDRWRPADPRILELHHLQEHKDGGSNTVDNLVVLCSRCHDEVHAGRIRAERSEEGPVQWVRAS